MWPEGVVYVKIAKAFFSCLIHILNWIQAKKFAKLELKTYIEEFEDKLNKFHMEKKEQEVTARNAQIHQQKIDSREGFNVNNNSEDHSKSNTSSG